MERFQSAMERFQSRDQQLRQFIRFVIGVVSKPGVVNGIISSTVSKFQGTERFYFCTAYIVTAFFWDLNLLRMQLYRSGTVEPLYNEVLAITNNSLYPSNSKIYEKEPRYNETSL